MTIVASPERRSRKQKPLVSETSPLLPEKHQDGEDGVHEGFNGASFSGAVFNLSTTVVGAGIMALPATMKVLGLILGSLLIIFVCFLTDASIDILLRFSRAGAAASYGGVMGDAFGKIGKMLLQICVIINNLGILIVYMIIIGDVLSGTSSNGVHHAGILEEWFGFHWWNGRVPILVFTVVLILAPLVSFKRVDSLKFTSALSVALAVVFVVITAGIAIVKLFSGTVEAPRLLPDIVDFTSFLKLFTVVPVIVTAYICHYNVHSIYNELEDPSEMQPIVRTSLALCSIVYISTSFFGFLLFGDQTMDDVLANFDTNLGVPYSAVLNDIVRVTYVVHLMLVFPLIFFALRLNLDGLVFPAKKHLVLDNKRFILITAGLIGVVFLGASFIPSIWDAFQFTGATAAVCIGFIFPASIALRDTHGISTRKDIYIALFMIFLAVVSSSIAITCEEWINLCKALYHPAMGVSSKKHLVLDNKRFILITAGLIGIVFLGASFIPSIWDAFQFTGATTAVCIGFIFPASIALRDTHGISTRKDIFIALLMIFLAVVSTSIAIVSDINSLFNKEEGPPRS